MHHPAWIRAANVVVIVLGAAALWHYRSSWSPAAATDPSGSPAPPPSGLDRSASGAGTTAAEATGAPAFDSRRRHVERHTFDRARADAIRRRAAELRAAEHRAKRQAAVPPSAAHAAAASGQSSVPAESMEEEARRREHIRRAVREQYFPIARSCYDELLGRDPKAAGKVVMSFAIVGASDAGVIDRVELGDGTTMDDPEFTQCMRESMYSTIFEPPRPGESETTVVYPIELRPE